MAITKYRTNPGFVSPINSLMNEFFSRDIGQFMGSDDSRRSMPSVNIIERDNEFELRMLAPGLEKQDLKLSIENDVLTINAEKKHEELKENERYTRREFTHSTFSRSFRLPETVKVEDIKASFKDGVLHLNIPKAEEPKPRTRQISID